MFKLSDFEKGISKSILTKGKDYYYQGMIQDICEVDSNLFESIVSGTEDYNVSIELGKSDEIVNHDCDCPHDSHICKHIVAVLYQLRENRMIDITAKKSSKTKKMTLKDLLDKVELDELREFVLYTAKKDGKFKLAAEAYFAHKDETMDIGERYRNVFKKIIKQYSSQGFVTYSEAKRLSKDLISYLDKISQLLASKNYRDASSVIQVLIIESLPIITFSDDSNGSIADLIFSTIELLDELIASEAAIVLKESLVPFFEEELAKDIYFDYGDFGYELLGSFELLCLKIFKEDLYLTYLEKMISNSVRDKFRKEYLTRIKLAFLGKIGKEDQLEKAIQENLSIPEVRRGFVQEILKKKEYSKAKELIEEGIKIAKGLGHEGTVLQWHKLLCEIAELEGDINTMRHYYNQFTYNSWQINKDYYIKLKGTYTQSEWTDIIEKKIASLIKDELKEQERVSLFRNYNQYNRLVSSVGVIYTLEGYTDRLFDLLKKVNDLDLVLPYLKIIKKEYSVEEIFDVLKPLIILETEYASSRSHYKNIGSKLISLKRNFPDATSIIDEVVEYLCKKYPRRPAMLDEFKKV